MAEAAEETADWTLGQIIATGIEALLLAIAIGVAWWAGRWAKRAAIAGDKTVEEAKAATRAAEDAVEVSQRQLRAYVVADTVIAWEKAYEGSTDNIVGYNFTIKWENCGVTPARRCQSRTSLGVFDEIIPSDFDYPDKPAPKITETTHVGPGQGYRSKVGGLSISDAEAVERGEKRVYVWSWLEYDDIFGRVRHRTEICLDLRISEDGQTCTPTIAGPFNGADEDCHHKPKT